MKARALIIIPTTMFFVIFSIIIFVNDLEKEEIRDSEPNRAFLA